MTVSKIVVLGNYDIFVLMCKFGIGGSKIVMIFVNVRALSSIVSYDVSWYQAGIEVTVRGKSIKILISEMEFWKHRGSILHDGALPWIENYKLYNFKFQKALL